MIANDLRVEGQRREGKGREGRQDSATTINARAVAS